MIRRPFSGTPLAGLALSLCLLAPATGHAALKRYDVSNTQILHSGNATPRVEFFPPGPDQPASVALFDESVSPPVMVSLRLLSDGTATVTLPGLSGFLFASRKFTQGPSPEQPGVSGSSASQIDWGTLTGWRITGRNWCNSEPASICLLAGDTDETTGPTGQISPFYNIGTWIFHGTGFTSVPFVYSRQTTGAQGDNRMYTLFGGLDPSGSVPGLPVLGLALLGAGVVSAGVFALRRR